MPCDTRPLKPQQTLAERMAADADRLRTLEQRLLAGLARFNIGPTGGIAIVGWDDRDGITDVCAYRTLKAQNSWAVRQAVAKAESQQGKKVNELAIQAGHHAHGGVWHGGH